MATTSDIRNGMMIRLNDDIYEVIEFLHVKPGKGQAFVRTKLKGVQSGKVINKTFSTGANIDEVRVERKPFQYIYAEDENSLVFMDMETYDQLPVSKHLIRGVEFLVEETICDLYLDDAGRVLKVELPKFVVLEVTYTEPGIRGDTVSNVTKPAKVSTGVEVKVPLFINIGDKIKIDTATGSYSGRQK